MSGYRVLLALVLSTVFLTGTLLAQDSLNVRRVGELNLPGFAWDVAVSGSLAYVAGATPIGRGFSIVDIHNPDSLEVIGGFLPAGENEGSDPHVAVSGDYAYVKDQYGVLRTANTSDPGAPYETNSCWWNGEIGNMAISGSYLLVVTNMTGLQIMSLANPAVPVAVASVDSGCWVQAVAVSGSRAYLSEWNGLRIVDISDPSAPQILGGIADTSSRYYGVIAVEGTHVYTAVYSHQANDVEMQVLDVSDPNRPVVVGAVRSMSEPLGLFVSESHVFWTSYDRYLRVFDASDPALPVEVGYYRPAIGLPHGMTVTDGDIYLAAQSVLYVLQYENPQGRLHARPVANEYGLHPAYPNPFNSSTRISFSVPTKQHVELVAYDVLGREVQRLADGTVSAGEHDIVFDGSRLNSGMYFVKLSGHGASTTQKVVLLK